MFESKAKILIVDDEPAIRTALSMLLGELGHSTRTAEDGFSALACLRKEIPDVLISDLFMPRMSGFELTSVVRRRFPQVRVIVMSGAFRADEVPSGVAADAFFPKDANVNALLRILQTQMMIEGVNLRGRIFSADSPIWVQPGDFDRSRNSQLAICCPECLRAFSESAAGLAGGMRETTCVYCRSRIRYSIVPSLDPASISVFQRGRSKGLFRLAEAPHHEH